MFSLKSKHVGDGNSGSKNGGGNSLSLKIPLFYGFWFVFNAIMAHRVTIGNELRDFRGHNTWATAILDNGFDLSNLYHNGVAFIAQFLEIDIPIAASIFVLLMQMLLIIPIHYWAKHHLGEALSEKWLIFVVAIASLAGSIPNLLGPNLMYYFAFGIRVWHNPTSFSVMPFVMMSFFLFCRVLEQANMSKTERQGVIKGFKFDWYYVNLIVLTILIFLSVYGKVSWLPPFAMAALLYLFGWWAVAKFSLKRMIDCILIGLTFVPAGLLALWISSDSVYARSEFVFQLTSHIRLFPVLLNLSFPLFALYFSWKQLKSSRIYQMAWLAYGSALLQGVFIIEVGREHHGNLTWAILYSLNVLLMVSLIEFIKFVVECYPNSRKGMKWHTVVAYVGLTLAVLYMFGGLAYALHLYNAGGRDAFWI